MKQILINDETHSKLKSVAVDHGIAVNRLADAILRGWNESKMLSLPELLRVREHQEQGKS